jgi:putative ferrous iron transport protein C
VILADLKDYLQARRQATLSDIALHFRAEPDAVRQMLSVWQRKGRVRRLPAPVGCGGSCTQCEPAAAEVYLWVDPGDLSAHFTVQPGCRR